MKQVISALGALLLVTAITAPAVQAHQGNPDFRSEITSISPARLSEGLQVTVQNFDDNVQLVNRTGETVVVEGYEGEPYLRFSPDGLVEVNLNSPAYYLNEDRLGDVSLPDRANADAEPDWSQVNDSGTYSWHDHRSHYMSDGVPPQVSDESAVTKIFDYVIPVTVGGSPVSVAGTLTWVGSDSSVPAAALIALGALLLAAVAGALVVRHRRQKSKVEQSGEDSTPEAW